MSGLERGRLSTDDVLVFIPLIPLVPVLATWFLPWKQEPERWTTVALVIWCILLVPWVPFALLSGMAFDAGYTINAYIFVCSLLTYPVAILAAALGRRKKAFLALLPCVNLVGFLISGFGGK